MIYREVQFIVNIEEQTSCTTIHNCSHFPHSTDSPGSHSWYRGNYIRPADVEPGCTARREVGLDDWVGDA